jgi:short-subunit dehydrogenase
MAVSYWQNKICAVTGGSAGLGLAVGRALAQRGAQVLLIARHQEPLAAAAAELRRTGGEVRTIVADVTWQEDVDRLAATVAADFGRLDLLCNAAGRSSRAAILDATPEDFQQLLDVNFLAVARTTRALAPLLMANHGHLVNIGSLASKTASKYLGAYPASKFALAAYTQQLRLELTDAGLHVLLVCPGPIARDDAGQRYAADAAGLPAKTQLPGGGAKLHALDPDKLAAKILVACERRRAELVVPAKARVLFALAQLSPKWGDWLLGRATRG